MVRAMPGITRASGFKRKWSVENMTLAVEDVRKKKMTVRDAACYYSVPKSTLQDRVSSKYEISSRPGPSTALSQTEEDALATWATEMAAIGYRITREKLVTTVKQVLDESGKQVPQFNDNKPGKDWWYGFLRRHPHLTTRHPEALGLRRAKLCSPENLDEWFTGFEDLLKKNNINDPSQIFNCNESGFPFQAKSGRIIVEKSSKHEYKVSSNSKHSITTLVCICADGTALPPFHIYPGKVFSGEFMEGAVPNAYFGITKNGWIDIPHFYGWLSNRFIRQIPPKRPVVLLLDDHLALYNIEISTFCKENGILLYCLPPHSFHLTQPLDVGFFKSLKDNYYKEVASFNESHPGNVVTKKSFASVYHNAWLETVNIKLVTNCFKGSGIWPIIRAAISDGKLKPSQVFTSQTSQLQPSQSPTPILEKGQTTLLQFFSGVAHTGKVQSSGRPTSQICSTSTQLPSQPSSSMSSQPSTQQASTDSVIRHISSDELIKLKQEKKKKKREAKEMKKKRAKERVANKRKRDEEKAERKKRFQERKRKAAECREEHQRKKKKRTKRKL